VIHRLIRAQRGQTLVTVALLMVVFMGFLALAIDVGLLLSERRRMQNAADAGALAGARELCLEPKICEGVAEPWKCAALEYAIDRNLAPAADVTLENWTVTVHTRSWVDLIFARIFGIDMVHVDAVAAAACGEARSACGLWPVALDMNRYLQLYGERGCSGEPFYLWNGNNDNKQLDCDEECDCDPIPVGGDGFDDIVGVEGRTWVDFTNDDILAGHYGDNCAESGGCGTDELRCWVLNDSATKIGIEDCIAGDNGTRAALQKPVDDRAGDIVSIPLFDDKPCTTDGFCPGGRTYHIAGFGCVKISENAWDQSLELPFKEPNGKTCWKGKVIEVSIACNGCDTDCGSVIPDTVPPAWGIRAVGLVR